MQTTVRLFTIPVFFLAMMFSKANAQPHAWEQPRNVSWNKEPAHATFYPFEDAASALSKDREQSPFFRSLNGLWKFKLAPHTDAVEPEWTAATMDVRDWEGITVPGNWEMSVLLRPSLSPPPMAKSHARNICWMRRFIIGLPAWGGVEVHGRRLRIPDFYCI